MYLEDEGKEWMVVVVYEEREKKLKKQTRKVNIFMKYSIK